MADVLAALEQLDKQSKKPTNTKTKRLPSRSRRGSTPDRNTRRNTHLSAPNSPRPDTDTRSIRSESQGPSSRRISFAEPARPSATSKRYWIPTAKDSLASGFPFDSRLQKYGIAEQVWERFNSEILELADVPGPSILWPVYRKDVINKMRKEMQYDGDFKRKLKMWNKAFKQRGFQIELALPGEQVQDYPDADEDESLRKWTKKDGKRFRMIVTPNAEKGTSVYSRTSSLTRSVTNEGANLQQAAAKAEAEEVDEPDNP